MFPLRLKYILHACDQGRDMGLTYQVADEMPCSRNKAWNDIDCGAWQNYREKALQFCSYVPLSDKK